MLNIFDNIVLKKKAFNFFFYEYNVYIASDDY